MTRILAIDPGTHRSAWLVLAGDRPTAFGLEPNRRARGDAPRRARAATRPRRARHRGDHVLRHPPRRPRDVPHDAPGRPLRGGAARRPDPSTSPAAPSPATSAPAATPACGRLSSTASAARITPSAARRSQARCTASTPMSGARSRSPSPTRRERSEGRQHHPLVRVREGGVGAHRHLHRRRPAVERTEDRRGSHRTSTSGAARGPCSASSCSPRLRGGRACRVGAGMTDADRLAALLAASFNDWEESTDTDITMEGYSPPTSSPQASPSTPAPAALRRKLLVWWRNAATMPAGVTLDPQPVRGYSRWSGLGNCSTRSASRG